MPVFAALARDVNADDRFAAIALVWTLVGIVLATLLWPGGRGRRLARQVFAVAVLSFREGLRLKVLYTVALLALLLGGLAFFTDADGTHAGRSFVILNYCLSSGEVLGAMLIVLLSALSVAREIESRIMHTFGTKPIPRWGILLGKTLGFWAIDLLFIAGLLAFTAVLVRAVPLRPEARSAGTLVKSGTWQDLRRNALTTREFEYAHNERGGATKMKMIKPGAMHTWNFAVSPQFSRGEDVAVRLLFSSTATFASHIDGIGIKIGFDNETPLIHTVAKVPQDRPFELFLSPEQLNREGELRVMITAPMKGRNPPSIVGGVKLGVAADGLSGNLVKAGLLIALQGWILAVITTSWSGVLSFPVTVALGLILVLGGEMSRHALDLMQAGAARAQTLGIEQGPSGLQQTVTNQLRFLLGLLPDFRVAGGPTAFVQGELISAWAVAKAILMMGLVRGVGWALPGIILFHRREVGR